MQKLTRTSGWVALAAGLAVLGAGGCASDSGSKEFIPGKGWKSTQTEMAPGSGAPQAPATTNARQVRADRVDAAAAPMVPMRKGVAADERS